MSVNDFIKSVNVTTSTESYTQPQPQLPENMFSQDCFLQMVIYVLFKNTPDVRENLLQNLRKFSSNISYTLNEKDQLQDYFEPYVIYNDCYGKSIPQLSTSPYWRKQKHFTSSSGIVADSYKLPFSPEVNRMVSSIKTMLSSSISMLFSCPTAMTDGAAYILRKYILLDNIVDIVDDDQNLRMKPDFADLSIFNKSLKKNVHKNQSVTDVYDDKESNIYDDSEIAILSFTYNQLTSYSPSNFETSGQWMTEIQGGSDLRNSVETSARLYGATSNIGIINGIKFFTSATDSEYAVVLTKLEPTGEICPFLIFGITTQVNMGKIEIIRLKNKCGTRQVPTAELRLIDAIGIRLSSPKVSGMSIMMEFANITRMHNIYSAISYIRNITFLAIDYAKKRRAFGKLLIELPNHLNVLNTLSSWSTVLSLVPIDLPRIFEYEPGISRLLLPSLKATTAKLGIYLVSEGIESFGALGYMEDSLLPMFYRDVQVLPIWEGTTNVLCQEIERFVQKNPNVLKNFINKYCINQRDRLYLQSFSSYSSRNFLFALSCVYFNYLLDFYGNLVLNSFSEIPIEYRGVNTVFYDGFNRDFENENWLKNFMSKWPDQEKNDIDYSFCKL